MFIFNYLFAPKPLDNENNIAASDTFERFNLSGIRWCDVGLICDLEEEKRGRFCDLAVSDVGPKRFEEGGCFDIGTCISGSLYASSVVVAAVVDDDEGAKFVLGK